MIEIREEVIKAEDRIRNFIRETPINYSPYLSREGSCEVFLKLENLQITGAFKLRGAANKLLSLSEDEKRSGVVTASSGNHGCATAYMMRKIGIDGEIFLPENVSRTKLEALRLYGAKIKFHGDDCVKTETFARESARKSGRIFIPPYNDLMIVSGQGTIGFELEKELENIDVVLAAVGGGGLISGIGGYLKSQKRDVRIIGCQPENSAVMYESIKAGKVVDIESKTTLSDGTAGGIEEGSITFDLCKEFVDDFILVTEDEIRDAILVILEREHLLIEGAAALTVASFLKFRDRWNGMRVVLIISGGNIGIDRLKSIIC